MPQIIPQAREKGSHSLTRAELYELVWTSSSVQVAKSLGVSDVAIAKICKRYDIPKPPLGYWARVRAGQNIPRAPLSVPPASVPEMIEIGKVSFHPTKPAAKVKSVIQKGSLHIPDNVPLTHPLIKKTLSALSNTAKDKYHRIWPSADHEYLNVSVGKDNIKNALRIMQILINNLERLGYSVKAVKDDERSWQTIVTIDGQPVKIKLEEPSVRKADNPPKDQWGFNRWIFLPSGRLHLIIDEYAEGLQRQWRVALNKTLDQTLSSFITGLIEMAKATKIRKARWEQERLVIQAAMKRQMLETERINQLKSLTVSWDDNRRMNGFLEDFERRVIDRCGKIDPNSKIGEWISWAKEYVKRIDPLEGIIRDLDLVEKDNP